VQWGENEKLDKRKIVTNIGVSPKNVGITLDESKREIQKSRRTIDKGVMQGGG